MKDNEIISLFELRDEHAIEALSDKYHPYPSIDAQSAEISITKVQLWAICACQTVKAAIPKQS